ncbi:interleukin-12 subunit beta [Hoplias malabaricus]|uniref:interleukin-12 subunit beta n=1 Tax=Hoplias malabaricus TaxID=27720 RepID=UPI003461EEF7
MCTALRIISFILFSIARVSAVDTFPEKFLLGEIGSDVTLNCHTDDHSVTWKHASVEIETSQFYEIKGRKLILHDFAEDQLGNYTCWSKGEVVDYSYILLDVSGKFTDATIHCTAETFNCTYKISCKMNQPGFDAFRLQNKRDNTGWVQPSEDGVFYLTHSTNPYAEEVEQLQVIGEAMSSSDRYFKIKHSFYLRDIIKPAKPILNVNKSEVSLDPPATWTKPHSYYPLEHEYQCLRKNDGLEMSCELDSNKKIPKGMSMLRVRCRDPLLLSQWSEWTPWQNVRRRRGKKQKKKNGTKLDPL